MNHYVKPTLCTTPYEIILHIGTNNLRNNNPAVVINAMGNLADNIARQNKDVKVTLSEVITRSDDHSMVEKKGNWSFCKKNIKQYLGANKTNLTLSENEIPDVGQFILGDDPLSESINNDNNVIHDTPLDNLNENTICNELKNLKVFVSAILTSLPPQSTSNN
ncbi:RNA-directed DNA polymerase from transposon X-element [Paramuricea clavata]|uniref:RNA-directed DNA polymerase from transposon X-element n=1 Tax=Paramuricea clavata TaxID=317549 RepID=A0A6S7GTD7_PARCT|nr:RNA-directed DNA polymerase from transposon X-element [Paramuricea clavata]